MSIRKVCAACLTAMFAAGAATALQAAEPAKTAPSTFKPGTYTATVNGHNAPVTVKGHGQQEPHRKDRHLQES